MACNSTAYPPTWLASRMAGSARTSLTMTRHRSDTLEPVADPCSSKPSQWRRGTLSRWCAWSSRSACSTWRRCLVATPALFFRRRPSTQRWWTSPPAQVIVAVLVRMESTRLRPLVPAASAPRFVTESELEKLKALRGGTVEDGTASADRPLHDVLRENKEKKARRQGRG